MLKLFDERVLDDSHEFKPLLAEIEDTPVSPLARATFWIVLVIIISLISWLYLGQVDVVVSAPGKIMPQGKTQVIQPYEMGVIQNILVAEGDRVKKGQVLVEIDQATTDPQLDSLTHTLEYTQLEIDRIQATINNTPFSPDTKAHDAASVATQETLYAGSRSQVSDQKGAKQQEIEQIQQQLAATKSAIQHDNELLALDNGKKDRLMPVKDIIPRQNLEQIEADLVNHQNQLQEDTHKLSELNHRLAQLGNDMGVVHESFRNSLLMQLAEKQKQAADLAAQIDAAEFKQSRQVITAPVSGTIDEVMIHTVGGVVTPAEKIMSLIPDNEPMVVEAVVQNRDVGYITKGMPVRVKVDTFDFQKYGTLNGVLQKVSSDSHQAADQPPAYKATVLLKQTTLRVNGKREPIKAGMTVTTEVKVGKRRIIEFFIYPLIKALQESVSVR